MSEKKKLSLMHIILIFLGLQVALAVFSSLVGNQIKIGAHPETGQSGVWLLPHHVDLKEMISEDMQPDVYVMKKDEHGQLVISDPWKFTYGSQKIYHFFHNLFREDSPAKFFGQSSGILNFRLWRMLIYLDIFIILLAFWIRKGSGLIPSKPQVVFEFIYGFLGGLVMDSIGKNGKKFIPFFLTLFFFIWLSNWTTLVPIPGVTEPTRNLNVPLGLGMASLGLVHLHAIKKKGLLTYIKGYFSPIFFMFPLNVIGEISKLVSISFRLFGNIFGGAIITIVVMSLTKSVLFPVGLSLFFTMFVGTLQAFVFTMLSLTYLSMEIGE